MLERGEGRSGTQQFMYNKMAQNFSFVNVICFNFRELFLAEDSPPQAQLRWQGAIGHESEENCGKTIHFGFFLGWGKIGLRRPGGGGPFSPLSRPPPLPFMAPVTGGGLRGGGGSLSYPNIYGSK